MTVTNKKRGLTVHHRARVRCLPHSVKSGISPHASALQLTAELIRGDGFKVHFEAQRADYIENVRKARISIHGKDPVQARSPNTGIERELSKTFEARYVAQRSCQQTGITYPKAAFQMYSQLLIGYALNHFQLGYFYLTHSDHLGDAFSLVRPAQEASQARVGEGTHPKKVVHPSYKPLIIGSISMYGSFATHSLGWSPVLMASSFRRTRIVAISSANKKRGVTIDRRLRAIGLLTAPARNLTQIRAELKTQHVDGLYKALESQFAAIGQAVRVKPSHCGQVIDTLSVGDTLQHLNHDGRVLTAILDAGVQVQHLRLRSLDMVGGVPPGELVGHNFTSFGVWVLSQSAKAALISSFQFGPAALNASTTSASSQTSTHSPATDLSGMSGNRLSLNRLHCGVKGHAQRMRHLEDGFKTGVAFAGQRLVKAFTTKTSISRQLGHSFGPSNDAKSLGDECGVIPSLFNAGFEILEHVLFGLEVFGTVPLTQLDGHDCSLQLPRNVERALDVFRLSGLVATRQQNHEFIATLDEVHPIARPVVDAQLGNTVSDRLAITKIPVFNSVKSSLDAAGSHPVSQPFKPAIEHFSRGDDLHNDTVRFGIHIVVPPLPFSNSPRFPTLAKRYHSRYSPPVAANSATGFSRPTNKRRHSVQEFADAFFVSAISFYGGCAWDAFGRAGFLLSRSANPRTATAQFRLAANGGSSLTKGALPMQHVHALNPSSTRLAIAIIGAELIAYRVNRQPEQRARLLGLVQMADTLGALNASDRAALATTLNVRGAA